MVREVLRKKKKTVADYDERLRVLKLEIDGASICAFLHKDGIARLKAEMETVTRQRANLIKRENIAKERHRKLIYKKLQRTVRKMSNRRFFLLRTGSPIYKWIGKLKKIFKFEPKR